MSVSARSFTKNTLIVMQKHPAPQISQEGERASDKTTVQLAHTLQHTIFESDALLEPQSVRNTLSTTLLTCPRTSLHRLPDCSSRCRAS